MLKNNNSEIFEILETGISRVTSFIQHSNFFEICEKATRSEKNSKFQVIVFCITLKNEKFKIFSLNFNEYKDHHLRVVTSIPVLKGFNSNIN